MFQGINVKSHVSYFPACWHEQMYWSDRKQTSLPTEAWGKKSASVSFGCRTTEGKTYSVYFLYQPGHHAARCQPAFFSLANAEVDQNPENKVTSWPQVWSAGAPAAIKTEVVSHTIETADELVMIEITLFALDTDIPFWPTEKLPNVELSCCNFFQAKWILWC